MAYQRLLHSGAWILASTVLSPVLSPVLAQERASNNVIEEVIVTAQKREQSLNDVPMSIQAATGEDLKNLQITEVADLGKIAVGFTSNVTQAGTPIYTIRGIGFQETSLATSPTVSVYLDEAPLQFAPMTLGTVLDVQRVEVLKGPQGTLFGQNATGGAVNFIANKPTDEFEAGIDVNYGRFNRSDIAGFVSGPINDSFGYRLAGRVINQDDWQDSDVTGDEAGEKEEYSYRGTFAYDGGAKLRARVTLSGFTDKSDTLRPQLVGKVSQNTTNGITPEFAVAPLADDDARDADWSPCTNQNGLLTRSWADCIPSENDTDFFSGQLRIDYDITDNITFTSLTSYNDYERNDSGIDQDGTYWQIYETTQRGTLETTFQEFRLAGNLDFVDSDGSWVVGVNYEDSDTEDRFVQSYGHSSVVPVFGFIDYGPTSPWNNQEAETWAIFGNIEYGLTDTVTLQGGVRYTDQERDFTGCTDDGGDGTWALTSALIQDVFYSVDGTEDLYDALLVEPGECATTGPAPEYHPVPTGHKGSLDEDNTSWRVGVNWAANDATLVYGNVSKGFKNGQFPTLPGSAYFQLFPVVQEELLAYEVGAKTTLLDDTLQLNGAIFYYDYTDKQVRGALEDPIFGSLPALVNVPESHVQGFELVATWLPIQGLTISPSVSYSDSEIDGNFRNFDAFYKPGPDPGIIDGNEGTKDFSGQDFPHAPEWQANLAINYNWEVGRGWFGFVGGNVNYQDETTSFFVDECKEPGTPCTATDAEIIVGNSDLPIPDRTLVDLRAGIENDRWKVWVWGLNVTDEYYWTRSSKVNDSMVNFAGMPRTYGVGVSFRN